MSNVTAAMLPQFNDEDILQNKLNLHTVDYSLLNLSSLKYGAQTYGTNDIYAVSEKTGKVYYVKGLTIGNVTYFSLTDELKSLINFNTTNVEGNTSDGIVFVPSTTEWTRDNVTANVKVPKAYTLVTVKANTTDITVNSSIVDPDYTVYTVSGVSGNYTVSIAYNNGSETRSAKFEVNNVDNVIPEIEIDSTNQKIVKNEETNTSYAYMNITKKLDSISGVRLVKYENEKIDPDKIESYFKSNGKSVTADSIPIDKNVSYITVYIEDNAGNWTSKWIEVTSQIYIQLLS
ncbi:hypothetical protein D3C73_1056790 [compost metagenome]